MGDISQPAGDPLAQYSANTPKLKIPATVIADPFAGAQDTLKATEQAKQAGATMPDPFDGSKKTLADTEGAVSRLRTESPWLSNYSGIKASDINRMIAESPDPADALQRYGVAANFASLSGDPLTHVLANLDAYSEYWTNKPYIPKTTAKAIADSFGAGYQQYTMSKEAAAWADAGGKDDGTLERLNEIQKKIDLLSEDQVPRSWLTKAIKISANSLPQMGGGMLAGLGVAGGVALIATGVGAPVGAGTVAASLMEFGNLLGQSADMYQSAKGKAYLDLRNQGHSHSVALGMANLDGVAQATLEGAFASIPGIGALTGGGGLEKILMSQIAKKTAQSGVLGLFARGVARGVINAGGEGLEGVWQTGADTLTNILADSLEDVGYTAPTAQEALKQAGRDFAGGFMAAGVLGLGLGSYAGAFKTDVREALTVKEAASQAIAQGLDYQQFGTEMSRVYSAMPNLAEYDAKAQGEFTRALWEAGKRDQESAKAAQEKAGLAAPDIGDEEATGAPVVRDTSDRLYTQNRVVTTDDNGEIRSVFKLGDPTAKGKSKRLASIDYETDGETLTIREVTGKIDADTKREFILDLLEQNPGKTVDWHPKSEEDQAIYDGLVRDNPRGPEAGIQWYSEKGTIDKVRTREAMSRQLRTFVGKTDLKAEQIPVMVATVDNFAQSLGMETDELITTMMSDKGFTDQVPSERALRQNARGATSFERVNNALKSVIYFGQKADATTFFHESFHAYQTMLIGNRALNDKFSAKAAEIEDAFGVQGGDWDAEATGLWAESYLKKARAEGRNLSFKEAAAYAFEEYLRTGKAPTEEQRGIFQKIARWFYDVYQAIAPKVKMNADITRVFDSLMGGSGPLAEIAQEGQAQENQPAEALYQPKKAHDKNAAAEQKPRQPANTLPEVYALVEAAREDFTKWTQEIADKYGVEIHARKELKAQDRAARKINAQEGPESILDIDGKTLIAPDMAVIMNIMEDLSGRDEVVRIKDRFAKPAPGNYRDMLLNVKMPNGAIVELQVSSNQLLEAKDTAHVLYEVGDQVLAAVEAGRMEEAKGRQARDAAIEAMKVLNGKAYEATLAGAIFNASALDISEQLVMISENFQEEGAGSSVLSEKTRKKLDELMASALSSQSTKTREGSSIEGVIIGSSTTSIEDAGKGNKPSDLYQGARDIDRVVYTFPLELKAFTDIHSQAQVSGILNAFGRGVISPDGKDIRIGDAGTSHVGLARGMNDAKRFYFGYSREKQAVYIVAKNGMDTDLFKRPAILKNVLSQVFDKYKLNVAAGKKLQFLDKDVPGTLFQEELPPQEKIPQAGTYPAIMTDDGSIFADTKGYPTHVQFIQAKNIPVNRIRSGGWIKNGVYDASDRSDTMDYVERELAKQRVQEKRKNGALFQEAAPTDSPEFKAWFGKSKVVDDGGKPLVVYHGTEDFKGETFSRAYSQKGPSKLGFWFTDDSNYAEMFGNTKIAVFLSINKPKKITQEKWNDIRGAHGGDAAWFASYRDKIIEQGFDGIMVSAQIDQLGGLEVRTPGVFAAFSPEQIKSVNNRGTWDPADPRILYQHTLDDLEKSARTFKTWEEFREYWETGIPKDETEQTDDMTPEQRDAFYQNIFEQAAMQEATPSTESIDDEADDTQFSEEIKTDAGLRAYLLDLFGSAYDKDFIRDIERAGASDEEEVARYDAMKRAESIIERSAAPAVYLGAQGVASGKASSKILSAARTIILNNPTEYRRLAALAQGDQETAGRLETKLAKPYILDPRWIQTAATLTIEKRRRLARTIRNEKLARKIARGDITVEDKDLADHIDYLTGEAKALRKSIAEKEAQTQEMDDRLGTTQRIALKQERALKEYQDRLALVEKRAKAYQDRQATIPAKTEAERKLLSKQVKDTQAALAKARTDSKTDAAYLESMAATLATQKERNRLKAMEAERRALKGIRDEMRHLAAMATKPLGKNARVILEYKKKIEELQKQLDPAFRTPKTLEKLAHWKDFLMNDPGAAEMMPDHLIRQVQAKPLNDWTLDELKVFKERIDELRQTGAATWKIRHNSEQAARTLMANDFKSSALAGKEFRPSVGRAKPSSIWTKAKLATFRPLALFMELDGDKRGAFTTWFFDKYNEAVAEKNNQTERRKNEVMTKIQELGFTLDPLDAKRTYVGKEVDIDGFTYSNGRKPTIQDVAYWSIGLQNDETKRALLAGNFLTEAIMNKAVQAMTPDQLALAEVISKDFDSNFDRLREAFEYQYNFALNQTSHYVPMRRLGVNYDTRGEEVAVGLVSGTGQVKTFLNKGFTKNRKEITDAFQTPIRTDLVSLWAESIEKEEAFISEDWLIKRLQDVTNRPEVSRSIQQRLGPEGVRWFKKYINDIAQGDANQALTGTQKLMQNLRGRMAVSYLSFNVLSNLKQLVSVLPYIADANPFHIVGAAGQYLAGITGKENKLTAFVHARSDIIKNRKISRDFEDVKRMEASNQANPIIRNAVEIEKRIGAIGMQSLEVIDHVSVCIGWKAVYDNKISKGMSELEAIQAADDATVLTQPSGRVQDMAEIYRSGETMKMFTMFTNALNAQWNMMAYRIPAAIRQKKYLHAVGDAVALALCGLGIALVSGAAYGGDDEDKKKRLVVGLFSQYTDSLPLVGSYVTSALERGAGVKTFVPSGVTPFPWGANVVNTIGAITQGDIDKAFAQAAEGAAYGLGLPVSEPKRVIKAIAEQDPALLLGWKKE